MAKASKDVWTEIYSASADKLREIKYSGKDFAEKLAASDNVLPKKLFSFTSLNYLELSISTLAIIPEELGDLQNLTNLVLRSNQLTSLPPTIGKLSKLKYFDVSFNQLPEICAEICNCTEMQTLNISGNKLQSLPENFGQLINLAHFDVSKNEFTNTLPLVLCDERLRLLAEINFHANRLDAIPWEINRLVSLKNFNLSDNSVAIVPGELGECLKLKELHLENNRLKDKRLEKLINGCQQKSIIDYVKKSCPKLKPQPENAKNSKSAAGKKKKSKGAKNNDKNKDDEEKNAIVVLPCSELKILVNESVLKDIRPYLLCCIVKNLDFSDRKNLQKFLAVQTKLHDEDCKKRVNATIATHDLEKIKDPLIFTGKPPAEIMIKPLGRNKECSAEELMEKLNEEAEAVRKEKKRNVFSGIHQYLYLLKDKERYPCIIDSENQVISFPPITNSDFTKISDQTVDVLVEVSSSQNLAVCQRVMEALVKDVYNLNISKSVPKDSSDDEDDDAVAQKIAPKILTIQQVKVVNEEHSLKSTFPSKNDLCFENIRVNREWEKNED